MVVEGGEWCFHMVFVISVLYNAKGSYLDPKAHLLFVSFQARIYFILLFCEIRIICVRKEIILLNKKAFVFRYPSRFTYWPPQTMLPPHLVRYTDCGVRVRVAVCAEI